jgi:hypothetical protein
LPASANKKDAIMELILVIAVVVLLVQAIMGPVLVRFNIWGRKNPEIKVVDFDEMESYIADKINAYCIELEKLGFEAIELFCLPDLMSNPVGPFAILLNEQGKTWAMVVFMKSDTAGTFHIEFCTEFFDESELCTNNSTQLTSFAKAYRKEVFQFPKQDDIGLMYAAHKHLINTHFGGRSAVLNGVGNEQEYLEASFIKDFVKQAELGYYYLDRSGTKYRPTLKGAILMTWKLIWPIGAFRKLLRSINAQNILREIRATEPYR